MAMSTHEIELVGLVAPYLSVVETFGTDWAVDFRRASLI